MTARLRPISLRRLPSPAYSSLLFLAAFILGAALSSCNWTNDPEDLNALSTAQQVGPSCASCHGYPLQDTNHVFHLLKYKSMVKNVNGSITCLDCHSTAIHSHPETLFDTLYTDNSGNYSTLEYPNDNPAPDFADTIRTFTLVSIDTVHWNRPTPMPARPGRKPAFVEYMTSLAHMNGTIDVAFDPRVSFTNAEDSARFNGEKAKYDPTMETCSAVACHPGDKPYRWAAPSKGFTVLKGE